MRLQNSPLVAFSHDIFTAQIAGGVTRCMIELMRALGEHGVAWSAWAGRNGNTMLHDILSEPWASRHIYSKQTPHRGRIVSSITQEPSFAAWVRQQSPSVVHRSYYPLRDGVGKRFLHVETLHDLWDERSDLRHDKGAALRSFLKKRACHRADAVVCVSEHTRNEAIDRWPELENRITVIPHGVRLLSTAPVMPVGKRPYFLFVGRRGFYKNFTIAADALKRSDLEHRLVCFGGGPFSYEERTALAAMGILDRTEQISGSDDQLAGFYMNAEALLYPSSFEGFGLPLLEAMIYRCPVISSPLTSLPEVGGDAVLYAEPHRPDAWSDAMNKIVHDPSVAAKLRVRGKLQAARFSWAHSAKLHTQLYEAIGQRGRQ